MTTSHQQQQETGLGHLMSSLLSSFADDSPQIKAKKSLESPSTEVCVEESSLDDEVERPSSAGGTVMIPPDLVSVSTAASDADDDSVSSLSTEGCTERRRSLFSKHWNTTANPSPSSQRRTRPFPKGKYVHSSSGLCVAANNTSSVQNYDDSDEDEDSDFDDDRSGNTYERTLKRQEGVKPNAITSPQRRSIFSNCLNPSQHQSQVIERSRSCFAIHNHHNSTSGILLPLSRRKAMSDSALIVKPLPSILRSPKYSPPTGSNNNNKTCNRRCSHQPVRFCQTVKMIEYEIPQEQWAGMGWSNYFY